MIPSEYLNQIVTGDARELAKRIPDESVDLIFTDPIYSNIDDYLWLAETAARVLKPDRACLVWQDVKYLSMTCNVMGSLNYRRQLIWYQTNKKGYNGKIFPLYVPCLWYDKGKVKLRKAFQDLRSVPFNNGNGHKWQKEPKIISYWLDAFTQANDIVFDPFTGGGTVPAVCKMLGRNYIAFEIEPKTAEAARERVLNTQPPLFVLEPEQVEMELS